MRISRRRYDSFHKHTDHVFFSPDGKRFKSKIKALNYLESLRAADANGHDLTHSSCEAPEESFDEVHPRSSRGSCVSITR